MTIGFERSLQLTGGARGSRSVGAEAEVRPYEDRIPIWVSALGVVGGMVSFWRLPNGMALVAVAFLVGGARHLHRKRNWQRETVGELVSGTLSSMSFPVDAACRLVVPNGKTVSLFVVPCGHPDNPGELSRSIAAAVMAAAPTVRRVSICWRDEGEETLYESVLDRDSVISAGAEPAGTGLQPH